jgi:transposase
MRDLDLFQQALGLDEPWRVVETSFDPERRRLDLRLDFPRGARFACPQCERSGCEVHDTSEKTWRHLDFFQHEAYLSARVPRVCCPEHGVRQVHLPWARQGSGFTLLFEALVMALCKEMPVRAVASLIDEHDARVWRVVHHYVERARVAQDLSGVRRVGLDETSFRRGQDYVSVFADLDRPRAIFATPGRDQSVVERFAEDLAAHGGSAEQITEICQDMSEAFLAGSLKHLPEAEITFDRYHVRAALSKALDEVRREERKGARRDAQGLTLPVAAPPREPQRRPAPTPRCTHGPAASDRPRLPLGASLRFDQLYELAPEEAEPYLRRFCRGAVRSRLAPIVRFAHMLEENWLGILRWFHSKVSNGLLEGLNSLVQAAKRRARGYRSTRNYIAMIYLVVGKLDLGVTHAK